jgi:hypothetical protein
MNKAPRRHHRKISHQNTDRKFSMKLQNVRQVLLAICLNFAIFTYGFAAPPDCNELNALVRDSVKATNFKLTGPLIEDGIVKIRGLDIDGDRKDDDVQLFCPNSGSLIPADPCTLEITFSSGGGITVEESRLYLIRYKSHIYAVGTSFDGRSSKPIHKIYSIGQSKAAVLICKK